MSQVSQMSQVSKSMQRGSQFATVLIEAYVLPILIIVLNFGCAQSDRGQEQTTDQLNHSVEQKFSLTSKSHHSDLGQFRIEKELSFEEVEKMKRLALNPTCQEYPIKRELIQPDSNVGTAPLRHQLSRGLGGRSGSNWTRISKLSVAAWTAEKLKIQEEVDFVTFTGVSGNALQKPIISTWTYVQDKSTYNSKESWFEKYSDEKEEQGGDRGAEWMYEHLTPEALDYIKRRQTDLDSVENYECENKGDVKQEVHYFLGTYQYSNGGETSAVLTTRSSGPSTMHCKSKLNPKKTKVETYKSKTWQSVDLLKSDVQRLDRCRLESVYNSNLKYDQAGVLSEAFVEVTSGYESKQ